MSKSSRTSLRSYGRHGIRKNKGIRKNLLKPYDFCCDINNQDNETRYDARKCPFSSSLTVLSPIRESPLLKFRVQSIEPVVNTKRESIKGKPKATDWDRDGNQCLKTRGPLLWFQEDEIELARHKFWSEKQKIYNDEGERNVLIGESKVKKRLGTFVKTSGPRWYQDLSIPQMKQVLALGETITADYEETITVRTQKALAVIGVTSTFCKVTPQIIKKFQHSTKLQPIQFLREIYKKVTGQYFEEEEYKKSYDCNERIILSAIAFLALPDTVIELNDRLPPISPPVFPSKPKPPPTISTGHGLYKSPYQEPLFEPPDWVTYRKALDKWHEKCKLVPKPRVILPKIKNSKANDGRSFEGTTTKVLDKEICEHSKTKVPDFQQKKREESENQTNQKKNDEEICRSSFDLSIPTSAGAGDKQTFKFSISGLGENSGPVNYKICGTLKPPFPKRKSWLGEKEAHYIISGISEHENPPQCPVTYVMTGVSCVTPDNSDEKFLAELKLGDGPKRIYPAGRKNLSKNWQEWLQDADEEFLEVEREANKLIQSVEATMRLVMPGARCDGCCSCRQTRKTNLKEHATKTPYMVIDSIAESDNQNRYIVGSLALHSPAPSPEDSTVNLLEVVASKHTIQKKLVINGITNDNGETTYYISGVTEEIEHIPKTTVFKERPPKPLRNVPPCACAIEQIFNEGKTQSISCDDIPHTKKKEVCYGHKYRPKESPAFTCRKYPDDMSCRRNPFFNKLKRDIFSKTKDNKDDGVPKEKKMFTLRDFNPCGDEDGMAVCGGPWGATNIPSPEIVAAREVEAKKILRAPPCGATPGKAICGGPWGATNPLLKVRKVGVEDDGEEDEEEDKQEENEEKLNLRELEKIAKEVEADERMLRKQQLKRDKLCSEKLEDGLPETNQLLTTKASPVYCDFDNEWNRTRTAPTVNPWENQYEKSLRLTQPVVHSSEHKVMNKEVGNGTEGSLKQKRKGKGLTSIGENCNKDRNETRDINQEYGKIAKDKVQVIYDGKQRVARYSKTISSQQLEAKSQGATKEHAKTALFTTENKLKDSAIETPNGKKVLKPKDIVVKNKDKKSQITKKRNSQAKPGQQSKRGNGRRIKSLISDRCVNNKDAESSKEVKKFKKLKGSRQNDAKLQTAKAKARLQLSTCQSQMLRKQEYKVKPALIPDEPHIPCQREEDYIIEKSDNCGCSDEKLVSNKNDGPKYGWRTKSQQNLPREKTLVYLAEPDDQVEMIKVREGGRPCTCRENRNNKKILIYNIGGAIDPGKSKRGSKLPQLIEGVTYITPPQSPRNSSEYIPEYDVLESPYEMCVRKRSDKDLKHINDLSTIRSLSPRKNINIEKCPCGNDPEENGNKNLPPQTTLMSKEDRWSAALKDEGLTDYFVRCQDEVPCWLRCAKFSRAGCCEKPKLLQVKKPVCECRYERRVVRRKEEKQKWVDRQQRLKTAKKQPCLQVSETSRPMQQDTKLIISSVKKVLRDGEFIPETQYCVSGVAENYAMGPPQYVTPGITMQSPWVTPEPSKPDILCMCGHRHWSPTDITGKNAQESTSVRTKGEYPCRGREQKMDSNEERVPNNGEAITFDKIEQNEDYHSCADTGGSCGTGFYKIEQSAGGKKRKQVNRHEQVADHGKSDFKKLKFSTNKVSPALNERVINESTKGGHGKKFNKLRQPMITKTEESNEEEILSSRHRQPEDEHVIANNLPQLNTSSPENKPNLFDLMKIELGKMASKDFILAKLPECWLMPQLISWIEYREGNICTESLKKELCELSKKQWEMMRQNRKPSIPLPSLNLTPAEVAKLTFDRADEMKRKIPKVQARYFSELRKMRVSEARLYWPTMEFGRFPNLNFKETYFTYLAGKEADGHVFRPWKIEDRK